MKDSQGVRLTAEEKKIVVLLRTARTQRRQVRRAHRLLTRAKVPEVIDNGGNSIDTRLAWLLKLVEDALKPFHPRRRRLQIVKLLKTMLPEEKS